MGLNKAHEPTATQSITESEHSEMVITSNVIDRAEDDWAPLHSEPEFGNVETVAALINAGADIEGNYRQTGLRPMCLVTRQLYGEHTLQDATKLTDVSPRFTLARGFVAQIGLRVSFPFPQTDLAYCLCDRYAKSGVAVEDCDADLDFRDLPFEVPRHERLAQ
jgi:hypothetical protein